MEIKQQAISWRISMHVLPKDSPGIRSEHLIVSKELSSPPATRFYANSHEIWKGKSEDRNLIILDNHLCNTSATQSLASNELLVLQGSKRIADGGDIEKNGSGDQTASTGSQTGPLGTTESEVNDSSHPAGCEAADKVVKLGGGWANPEKEGYFDEDQDE